MALHRMGSKSKSKMVKKHQGKAAKRNPKVKK